MVPSPRHTEPTVESVSRIGNSRQRQPIAADRAGDNYVGDLARRVAGVGIVGATGGDVAIKYSRYPGGIVVTHLCGQRCEGEKEQKGPGDPADVAYEFS